METCVCMLVEFVFYDQCLGEPCCLYAKGCWLEIVMFFGQPFHIWVLTKPTIFHHWLKLKSYTSLLTQVSRSSQGTPRSPSITSMDASSIAGMRSPSIPATNMEELLKGIPPNVSIPTSSNQGSKIFFKNVRVRVKDENSLKCQNAIHMLHKNATMNGSDLWGTNYFVATYEVKPWMNK